MPQILTVKLPQGASLEDGKALETEIKGLAEVKAAGVQQVRGLDLAAAAGITVWLNLMNPAIDVIKKIIEMIRRKGLSGVEIHLPNGAIVKVDSASTADLERLLKLVHQAP
jgi:hypothetical protein